MAEVVANPVTVPKDAVEASSDATKVTHAPGAHYPLASPWTFWYTTPPAAGVGYMDRLNKLGTFSSLEEFLPLYSYIIRPAALADKACVTVFRDDKAPIWESHPKGSRWMILLRKPANADDKLWLNRLWEQVVFGVISESFQNKHVVGASMEVRPHPSAVCLTLWLSTAAKPTAFGTIEHLRKNIIHLIPGAPIEWKANRIAISDASGHAHTKVYSTPFSPVTGAAPSALPDPTAEKADEKTKLSKSSSWADDE